MIVWAEEDRTKGMVSRRFVGKVDRANFRLGYMGGCVKKNHKSERVHVGKKEKTKFILHPLIHTLPEFNLAQDVAI